MDQQQSRWQLTRRHLLWTVGIIVALVGAYIFLRCAYVREWKWTGLVKNASYHNRTLWDWLDLLIVPVVLAIGGYLFTRSESRRTQDIANQQTDLDREIADNRRQDDTLQAYLDGMSQLLTDKDRPLHRSQRGDSLSTVARARTLTVLSRLDGDRKRSVLQFLYESGLIDQEQALLDESDLIERRHNIVSLDQASLSRAALSQANLSNADLRGADLGGAFLNGADLSDADLRDADLRGAFLGYADLRKANLSNANLGGTYLSNANLGGANLRKANLREATLSLADLSDADLRDADLREANLGYADLSEADLSEANLSDADLRGATLSEADLRKATLSGANLSGANLSEANLRVAFLSRAFLSEADLSEANLSEAILIGANLSGANLSEANLRVALLSEADLSGAVLRGADLWGTNLRGTDLRGATGWTEEQLLAEQLLTAYLFEGATMPNGQTYEDWLKDRERRGENGENE